MNYKYAVKMDGGSIGQVKGGGKFFEERADAMAYRKRMNGCLTPGEKSYYGMKYKLVKLGKCSE